MLSPVTAVTHPDPYPYYASLVADRPFHFDETAQLWVAADAARVAGILRHPACKVRPAAEPVPRGIRDTPAGEVFGRLVRMTDGELQHRVKSVVVDALGRVDRDQVAGLAARLTRGYLADAATPPFGELMLAVPPRVVATLCGLDAGAGDEAARLIGEFVRCIPASATAEHHTAAARAAERLIELMGPRVTDTDAGLLGSLVRAATDAGWHDTAPLLANGIGFLSQTYEATAGLIGNTLLALARIDAARQAPRDQLDRVVREVARHDAPVQNTRRFAETGFAYEDAKVEAGQAILLVLAAANRDPDVNPEPERFRIDRAAPSVFTFGAAAHRCPGEPLATTIATAVVGELLDTGFDPASLPAEVGYRPSPNARIPVL